MQRVIDVYFARLDDNVARSTARVLAADIPFYRTVPESFTRVAIHRAFEAVGKDLGHKPTHFVGLMRLLGEQRAAQGVAVGDILTGMAIGFDTVSDDFAAVFAADPEARAFWEVQRSQVSYAGAASLADTYFTARERVVRAQADEILRLSAQVLPLHRGVLLLPLVGQLAGERMQHVSSVLLAAVSDHRARVVLLDITGVPVVDAEAADHLLRAARAVRLLGATPLLVGVSAGVARTMVAGGVALGDITTLADLETGLRRALELTGA